MHCLVVYSLELSLLVKTQLCSGDKNHSRIVTVKKTQLCSGDKKPVAIRGKFYYWETKN